MKQTTLKKTWFLYGSFLSHRVCCSQFIGKGVDRVIQTRLVPIPKSGVLPSVQNDGSDPSGLFLLLIVTTTKKSFVEPFLASIDLWPNLIDPNRFAFVDYLINGGLNHLDTITWSCPTIWLA